jgi:tetratricopeptide (TPR) repeat protein
MDTSKPNQTKATTTSAKETGKAAPGEKVPPLFRRMDWLALLITFGVVWAAYLWTLAPELTLEDSGELCTGSYYAGIPHPPGYPFWAIWSYLWTVIVPFGNVAWRVEVGQSFASAMGCGLLALMVSRGSSMLIEGIEELRGVERRWETAICFVSGTVSGMLLGLGYFMWHESVVINRISIFGVPWLMAMIALLMRWQYAPQQRWYLYFAMLIYGWLATIHQSLLIAAPAVEIAVALMLPRLGRDLFAINSLMYAIILFYIGKGSVPALNAMTFTEKTMFHVVGISSVIATAAMFAKMNKLFTEWKTILIMGAMWAAGVAVYLYEPISCMTCPPMQWGYPRTVEGFFHALSRGQYGSGEATNMFQDPSRFVFQLYYLAEGLSESFSWVYMFIGLIPFLFLKKMHQRERNWIIGLSAIYLLLSVLLVILLTVSPDRSASDLNKVFFTASHALFAIMIGYGLTLMAAYIATHYQKFRRFGFIGGGVAVVLALYCLVEAVAKLHFGKAGQLRMSWLPFSNWGGWDYLAVGPNGQFGLTEIPHWIAQSFAPGQYGLPVFANLLLLAIPLLFIAALLIYRQRGPVLVLLALFCVAPVWSGMSHWYKSEQRNHWFGYWFGHDMFSPPFKDPATGKLSYDADRRKELLKDPKNIKNVYPEMARNTVLFGGTDPGRFCPTYTIFCESIIPHRCQPEQDQKFDRRDVYIITQNALADGTYLDYLRSQYNRSQQQDPPFFSHLFKYICAVGGLTSPGTIVVDGIESGSGDSGNGLIEGVASALYNTLDVPFTKWGQHVEKRRRAEGIYPPAEIYIPSPADSQQCFQDYTEDVGRRAQLNQLKPGEDVHIENGRVQVSGQVAVMNINGLLCKVIFDHCPTNEFYVEESFPLDWMYPYETPFGIIMKINRNPLPELSQDVFDLDHKFWQDFSTRLCGNFIDYNTPVADICKFVERTYVGNNFTGFIGDRRFARDDDAQKAFSKLRSSQAGMYAWRLTPQCPPEYRQKTPASQNALIRETDFAFKQAFAFCPYSPEAVYRYINFLLPLGRFDDALLVAETCKKLDPYNDSIIGLIKNLQDYKKQNDERTKAVGQIDSMEETARTNPNDVRNLITLAVTYAQMQQTNRTVELFDQALASPNLKYADAATIASYYSQFSNMPKLEQALTKLAALAPTEPEPHYDLAALQAYLGETTSSLANLKTALALNAARLKTNPSARDLLQQARTDAHLNSLRGLPEFQKLIPPQ